MRKITLLIIHCSATREGEDYTVEDIDRWHARRGFGKRGIHIGYHYVVYRDGSLHTGRPLEDEGAHTLHHNAHSIGICYIGGLDRNGRPADTRTPAQKAALLQLLSDLKKRFPHAIICGHNTFSDKDCPCFDAVGEYRRLQPDPPPAGG